MADIISEFIDTRKQIIKKDFSRMNPMQMQAVCKVRGPVLILAGAGSGKTTVLVNRIANMVKYGDAFGSNTVSADITDADLENARLYAENPVGEVPIGVAEKPVLPWQILAITFTNKAANELKDRIEAKLGASGADISAGTFHSTCARILRRYGDRLGYSSHFTIYDTDDQKRLMKEVYKQLNLDDKAIPAKTILNAISKSKDSLITPEGYEGGADFLKKQIGSAYALYQKLMKNADAMDFDDLLVNTVRLFTECPDILEYYQNRYRYIMVDEYQDTNHAQYVFVKMLAQKHRNICVVGDDDQSIYRFRGATIENILNFEQEYKDATVIRLEQNYRSTKTILNAANAVIKGNLARKGKNLWTENDDGDKITLYTANDEQAEARYIADKILDNVRAGETFSSHAVLYRTNAQANALENVFARSGVSYKVIGGFRFYERKEIRDVIAYLHVIDNPSDSVRLRRIINEPKRAIGDSTVAALAEIADGVGCSMFEAAQNAADYPNLSRAAGKLMAFCDMINELRRAAEDVSIHELLEMTLDKSGYMTALYAQGKEAEDRVNNVNELSSSIMQYEEENDEASLEGFLEEIALISDMDSYESGDDKVTLMTLHSAKGLEFDNVFISGMEEGMFPGNQSIYGGPDEIEEERRLAYVGITRAKKRLTLTNTLSRMIFGSTTRNRPSRFVDEIPEEYLDKKGVTAFGSQSTYGSKSTYGSSDSFGGHTGSYGGRTSSYGGGRPASAFGDFSSPAKPAARKTTAYAAQTTSAPASGRITAGMTVKHKTFGTGKVVKATPMSNDTMLEINFDKAGTKKLMSNFAKLDIVE